MESSLHYTMPYSLTFMFKDDDWFWKVFLGALAVVMIPLGIGYFFVIGYLVETVRRCRTGAATLPDWNKLGVVWINGIVVGSALVLYSLCASAALCAAARHTSLLLVLSGVVLAHAFAGPFVILRYLEHASFGSCFDLRAVVPLMKADGLHALKMTGCSFGIFVVVLCFGWMALIIGWPLFIFWGILVSASCTASLGRPAPHGGEAQVR